MLKNLKQRKKKKKKNITGKFFNNYLVFQHVDLKFCMVIVFSILQEMKNNSQPTGFEPVRGDPIGFRVQRLNHSATTAAV